MTRFIKLHIANTGAPALINTDRIDMIESHHKTGEAVIHQKEDYIRFKESFEEVESLLGDFIEQHVEPRTTVGTLDGKPVYVGSVLYAGDMPLEIVGPGQDNDFRVKYYYLGQDREAFWHKDSLFWTPR